MLHNYYYSQFHLHPNERILFNCRFKNRTADQTQWKAYGSGANASLRSLCEHPLSTGKRGGDAKI
ncbi:hypothetical protein QTP88_026202 [Uroleucon formosanum]